MNEGRPAERILFTRPVLTLMLSASLAACQTSLARIPLPAADVNKASVIGTAGAQDEIRIWGDQRPVWMDEFLNASDADLKEKFAGVYGKPQTYLALSGG